MRVQKQDKMWEVKTMGRFDKLKLKCQEIAIHHILNYVGKDSKNNLIKLAKIFEKHMDKAYDYIAKNWKPGSPIRMNPYGMDI